MRSFETFCFKRHCSISIQSTYIYVFAWRKKTGCSNTKYILYTYIVHKIYTGKCKLSACFKVFNVFFFPLLSNKLNIFFSSYNGVCSYLQLMSSLRHFCTLYLTSFLSIIMHAFKRLFFFFSSATWAFDFKWNRHLTNLSFIIMINITCLLHVILAINSG